MRGILFQYEMNPTTWVYLSSLMVIGIYFKFRRFWSLRNLDLVGLISLSPGLLLVYHGIQRQLTSLNRFQQNFVEMVYHSASSAWLDEVLAEAALGRWLERLGYIWLFGVGLFFLVRLFLDPFVVRRPLLEPNLSAGGLIFSGVALLVFLMSNVVNPHPSLRLEHFLEQQELLALADATREANASAPLSADGDLPNATMPGGVAQPLGVVGDQLPVNGVSHSGSTSGTGSLGTVDVGDTDRGVVNREAEGQFGVTVKRLVAIGGHLAVVLGLVLIGYRHFDNIQTGVAVATLYLILPYTSQLTSRVDHVVPAALLIWALQCYRRPILAGLLIGVAIGAIFYPLFLLPLWCSFYWRRGLVRFGAAAVIGFGAAALVQILSQGEIASAFAWISIWPESPTGIWRFFSPAFRIPIVAAFVAGCLSLALWPAQKHYGILLSCSAAVMLGAQFWNGDQGGLSMGWYLPLLLLAIFRPNLEDRVALSAVAEGWMPKKLPTAKPA